MAVKVANNPEVSWPVKVSVPADGGPVEHEVTIRYRLIDKDEDRERLREDLADAQDSGSGSLGALRRNLDPERLRRKDERLMEHITGWDGFEDEDGEPLPFSRENLQAILRWGFFAGPIENGLFEASRGAAPKNSATGSAG